MKGRFDAAFIFQLYTAAGIYMIQHALTMTELLAISGLSLVQQSIKGGANITEESVGVIHDIFGSSETSRALSSFIHWVRREFATDISSTLRGSLQSLAALTRSMLTFAIVQAATHHRPSQTHRMKVLYDWTLSRTCKRALRAHGLSVQPPSEHRRKASISLWPRTLTVRLSLKGQRRA